nr:hypothetical protein [uncultured Desulfobacter sp.]
MAQSTYGQNRAVFAEVVKAQAQTGQVQYDLLLLQDLEETQVTVLNALLNRPPQTPIGTLVQTDAVSALPGLELLFETAKARRELIAMADKAVQKAKEEEKLAGYAKYPDFKLGVTWSGIGEPDVASPPDNAGDDQPDPNPYPHTLLQGQKRNSPGGIVPKRSASPGIEGP